MNFFSIRIIFISICILSTIKVYDCTETDNGSDEIVFTRKLWNELMTKIKGALFSDKKSETNEPIPYRRNAGNDETLEDINSRADDTEQNVVVSRNDGEQESIAEQDIEIREDGRKRENDAEPEVIVAREDTEEQDNNAQQESEEAQADFAIKESAEAQADFAIKESEETQADIALKENQETQEHYTEPKRDPYYEEENNENYSKQKSKEYYNEQESKEYYNEQKSKEYYNEQKSKEYYNEQKSKEYYNEDKIKEAPFKLNPTKIRPFYVTKENKKIFELPKNTCSRRNQNKNSKFQMASDIQKNNESPNYGKKAK